ncbi:hypothetical protein MTR67_031336 [Solanum verrucosum]|uniref:Reverse transcriptase zinc-binding domain-containing protein n=1 Tax=Solanum verrucosum TaxID=315347 RepID=A0AAF0ZDL0_SOLVR|nr:hypothetical protein MTR67_031336 [Solanum verrucosum]
MEIHQRSRNELKCFFKIKVNNGAKTRFWKDEWHEEGNLERQFNDWEIPRMADLINKIEQFSGLGTDEDELWWKGNEKGTYKERLQRPFKVGKKLGFWQEADGDGESYQPAYGGQSRRREILEKEMAQGKSRSHRKEGMLEIPAQYPCLLHIAMCSALCNESVIQYNPDKRIYEKIGESTEVALRLLAEKIGLPGFDTMPSALNMLSKHERASYCNRYWESQFKKVSLLEFSRDRKMMSVLCNRKQMEIMFSKGAPESILSRCTNILCNDDGSTVPLSAHIRAQLEAKYNRVASFFGTLEQFKGTSTEADCLIWLRNKENKFTVKAAYRVLTTSNNQSGTLPWKMIWRGKIPHKVACFSWLLAREVVLTQDTLMKRGFNLCSRCFLCGKEAETISHLFLHCSWTDQLWNIFIILRGINWTMPGRVSDVLECWNSDTNPSNQKERWKIVPACI